MERHNPMGFAFARRRAQQRFEEGMTTGAIRLLRAVDEAQVRRFEAEADQKTVEEQGHLYPRDGFQRLRRHHQAEDALPRSRGGLAGDGDA